ncbi:MAG TPA: hypothetical protein PK156_16070 [Polyangium sp.]|nr:hypothetical protein [Polyangium sp.]
MVIGVENSMVTVCHVDVANVIGRQVLAGRTNGEIDRPRIDTVIRQTRSGDVVVLDLSNVEAMTSSYFSAALWPIWHREPELFPVLANIAQDYAEDIELLLRDRDFAAWHARWDSGLHAPAIIGELDSSLHATINHLIQKGEATAGDLLGLENGIGVTAWSNRLATLYQQRLVRRRKDGRRLIYAASWQTAHGGRE